ncbi:Glu/Leu/Phe/Val dehydrogenase family protein [Aliihoeflea sp. PC F10.4]
MLHALKPAAQHAQTTLEITDITEDAKLLPGFDGHERVVLGRDETRGLIAIVAIHDTRLGPALGGTRVWKHDSLEAAITDALRLSHGMTYKSAIAGMPFGGGKAVIMANAKTDKTPELLEAYAEMLSVLDGDYYTGEDVGLTLADADFLRARTPNVTGTTLGGSENPSPVTAHGVFLGLKASVAHRLGRTDLAGLKVAVQGLGSVGRRLCEELHEAGAKLVVADIDPARVAAARNDFDAEVTGSDEITRADVDVFAPCALGGVIHSDMIDVIRAKVIAGAANNQLAEASDAQRLADRGILYAPDYVINSGGLINVASELLPGGYDRARAMKLVETIPATLGDIFARAEATGRPTDAVAQALAEERLSAGNR